MTTSPARRFDPGLPHDFTVRLKPDVRVLDGGRTLLGGSPMRVARLTSRGGELVRDGVVTVRDAASRTLADRLLDGNLAAPDLGGAAVPTGELTVVIPVRDRSEQLDRVLAGLGGDLARIVVDDASADSAAVAAVAARHGARLLALTENRGPAGARNAGLAAANSPYVAFVDSDVAADPQTLLGLAGHFADGGVAAVAPRVRGATGSQRARWFERYDQAATGLDLGDHRCLVRPGAALSWVPSACLLVRREALGQGFAADLRVAEDVDLVWRLVAAGHRVRYDADFEVRHDSRTTLSGWLGRKVYYGTGGALLAERHGNLVAPAVLTPLSGLAAAALLAQRRWSLPVALGCTLVTGLGVRRALPLTRHRSREAGRLAALGLAATAGQTSQLLLRHWWPASVLASTVSIRARRALLAALVVDTALDRGRPPGGVLVHAAARQVDGLAYGAGLWIGAVRGRSLRALTPRLTGLRDQPRSRSH